MGEPNYELEKFNKLITERKAELERITQQYNELIQPFESKNGDGVSVHRMTGNMILIKCESLERQKEVFENIK